MSHDFERPKTLSAVKLSRTLMVQGALAEEVTVWLLRGFAQRQNLSPGGSPQEILATLVRQRLADRLPPERLLEALVELDEKPFLLETAMLILKLEGSWPSDPEEVFLVYSQILITILDLAPELHVPWSVAAECVAPE